tara:strand:+ start:63 stop:395 length:333 start_codon:yes stop_codon:yes gene_type:complete
MGFSFIKDVYPENFETPLPPTSAKNTEKYTMPVAFGDPYFNKPSKNDNFTLKLQSLEHKLDRFMNNKENFSQEKVIPVKNIIMNKKKRIENVLLFVMTFIFIGQVMENSF